MKCASHQIIKILAPNILIGSICNAQVIDNPQKCEEPTLSEKILEKKIEWILWIQRKSASI